VVFPSYGQSSSNCSHGGQPFTTYRPLHERICSVEMLQRSRSSVDVLATVLLLRIARWKGQGTIETPSSKSAKPPSQQRPPRPPSSAPAFFCKLSPC
jgi:hypothetical protein